MLCILVKQNSFDAEKCSVHFLVRNGSTASPTKPATNAPTALPTVNSPRANSLSSIETCRETAWGECNTIIPATRPRVEHRAMMIQMYDTKWYQDSNRKNIRWAISNAAQTKTITLFYNEAFTPRASRRKLRRCLQLKIAQIHCFKYRKTNWLIGKWSNIDCTC